MLGKYLNFVSILSRAMLSYIATNDIYYSNQFKFTFTKVGFCFWKDIKHFKYILYSFLILFHSCMIKLKLQIVVYKKKLGIKITCFYLIFKTIDLLSSSFNLIML